MKTKQYLLVTVVGVSLFAALMNLPAVLGFAKGIAGLLLPIIAGGILALFINVPMNGIENRLKRVFRTTKKRSPHKLIHLVSFFLTMGLIVLVFGVVLTLLVPKPVRPN